MRAGRTLLRCGVLLTIAGGCEPAVRHLQVPVDVPVGGISAPLELVVPEGTRSLTVVVEGEAAELYALASLRTADGRDQVFDMPPSDLQRKLIERYVDERVPYAPGGLVQVIRRGLFVYTFPSAPEQTLPPGTTSIRIATTAPAGGRVNVTIELPPDDGAQALHLNLVAVRSGSPPASPADLTARVSELLGQAGLTVVVDQALALGGRPQASNLGALGTLPEVGDAYTGLALAGRDWVVSEAPIVFLVEKLPNPFVGVTLGTPAPREPRSPYGGVIVLDRPEDRDATARSAAHEIGHLLGLQHPQNQGASGTVYPDALSDTSATEDNLMNPMGTRLTRAQAFVLSRSPLLDVE
jgi:hypothetical protein